MNFVQTVLAFLLALGPLIVFHELGHYTLARLCGVKVLRFSVGMGSVLWSRRFGKDQTEWAVSALPLGGYVKMLDRREDPQLALAPGELAREFTHQSVWRRIAIVAAGPLANFLLAIVLFAGLFMHGVEEPSTRIRFMPDSTPAWQAGLRGGDAIVAVNGKPVAAWSELRWEIMQAALDKGTARLTALRPGAGRLDLALGARELARVDLEGDVLGELGISVARPKPVLGKVMEGGAAQRAGLQAGDLITSIEGQPVPDGIAFIDAIRSAGAHPLAVGVMRDGRALTLSVTPELEPGAQHARIKAEVALMPEMVKVQSGPFEALAKGTTKTWDIGATSLRMVGKMIMGEVSWKNVTGPITIADYAGQSARSGVASFLAFIAFISISLGVMNLLPIPVLDGGLLLYYSLEVLTGRPLPERVGALAQRFGVGLLLMLMALAVFNDVARLL